MPLIVNLEQRFINFIVKNLNCSNPNSLPGLPLHVINTDIAFVPPCTFLCISVSNHDIMTNRNISQSVQNLYRRSNDVMSDFNISIHV